MDEKDVNSKYDRQIRLWSSRGQKSLSRSSVCIIGANTTASETLKNIVLAGIGRAVIIDNDTKVNEDDIASNFFISYGLTGKNRAEMITQNISEMNKDVLISVENRHLKELIKDVPFWNKFDCVILNQYLPDSGMSEQLSNILWENNVCLIKAVNVGLYGSVRIQMQEQDILETHDNNLEDLRIDNCWSELQDYIDKIDLDGMDDQTFSNVPYSIILSKIYQSFERTKNQQLTPSAIRTYIKDHLRRTGEEANLDQACNRAAIVLKRSSSIPSNLQDIFNNLKIKGDPSSLNNFWLLCRALKLFYEEEGILPLSGVIPDMESDTDQYITLKKLYENKFNADKNKMVQIVHRLLGEETLPFTDLQLTSFVKNCRFMQVHRGSRDLFRSEILTDRENSSELRNVNIYLALISTEEFFFKFHRLPTMQDRSKLRTITISLLCRYNSVKDFPDGLDKVLDELCRCSGAQIHNISALIGGIASQEAIKVITGQYVTLDNCLSYDGIHSQAVTWKI